MKLLHWWICSLFGGVGEKRDQVSWFQWRWSPDDICSGNKQRTKLSFVGGYYYGFYDSLFKLNANCSCNYFPSQYLYFDIADIAALIEPRPLIVQSGKDDYLAGERWRQNVLEPMKELESVYSLFGKKNRLYHQIVPGPHHLEKDGLIERMERVCID